MLRPDPRSNSHFCAYYKDNFILVQFIIVEFIETHHLILQIETLFEEILQSPQSLEKKFLSLIQLSTLLLQGSSSFPLTFSFHWTEGSLTKLKSYCENFCSNLKQKEKGGTQLHLALHQAELAAMHYFLLLSSNKQTSSFNETSFLSLKRAFESFKRRFNRVIRSIPRLVCAYCHNENILLCLLRKKGSLTKIYGIDFLAKYFKCSLTPHELMGLLLKQYQIRGFSSLPHPVQKHAEENKP